MTKPDKKVQYDETTKTNQTHVAFKPKILRRVTLPQFKVVELNYYKFDSAIVEKLKIEKDDKGVMVEKTVAVAHVTDLVTGEQGQIVVGSVLRGVLAENYANDSYVDKAFAIRKNDVAGKRYKNYLVDEIEA